jgi:hypothetical protein
MADIEHSELRWTALHRSADDPRPPAALVLGIVAAAQLVWVATTGILGLPAPVATVGAVLIATIASWWLTFGPALVAALIAFLMVDGFVDGQLGTLSWNGSGDAALLVILVIGCLCATEARSETDAARQRRAVNKP